MRFASAYLLSETAIESCVIPENVNTLGEGVFFDCPQLRKVTLPAALTTLEDSVFVRTPLLDTLILKCATPPSANESNFTEYTATLVVPCGATEAYRTHPTWGRFSNIIENCTGIEEPNVSDISIYTENDRIIVTGADSETVRIYDITGRIIRNESLPAGVYLVKVGNRPAIKTMVIR